MPSASQEQSMRKLCQMMGYNMGYYKSATGEVTISFAGDQWPTANGNTDGGNTSTDTIALTIPKFSNITNTDSTVNYFTRDQITLSKQSPSVKVRVMQGQVVKCQPNSNYLITIAQLDDNFRYYFPETQIAENGIFIEGGVTQDQLINQEWTLIDNLNTRLPNSFVYAFGYDSKKGLPYIQFPQTINELIGDGLQISYVRTQGLLGNVQRAQLSTLVQSIAYTTSGGDNEQPAEDFKVVNNSAIVNGADKQSIDEAYNNYKKTIGTFDTLVTCRDYMNAIYKMTQSSESTTPLVSNVNVTDIRSDLNHAITLCTFDDSGIAYIQQAINDGYNINHFDLVLYPFNRVYNAREVSQSAYQSSFKAIGDGLITDNIKDALQDYKTISHTIRNPREDDIVAIKNYYRINANITTTKKVNAVEQQDILNNVKTALYTAFNMRKVDFGEQFPFDDILQVIQDADPRIRNVAMFEPQVITKFATQEGDEYSLLSSDPDNVKDYKQIYNKLAMRNLLAGRLAWFNYDTSFSHAWNEGTIDDTNIKSIYPEDGEYIEKVQTQLRISGLPEGDEDNKKVTLQNEIVLAQNEYVQFKMPNFGTIVTYPAYVNYWLHLDKGNTEISPTAPANFQTIADFIVDFIASTQFSQTGNTLKSTIDNYTYTLSTGTLPTIGIPGVLSKTSPFDASFSAVNTWLKGGHNKQELREKLIASAESFYGHREGWNQCTCGDKSDDVAYTSALGFRYGTTVEDVGFVAFSNFVSALTITRSTQTVPEFKGLYIRSWNGNNIPGEYIDNSQYKYLIRNTDNVTQTIPWKSYYIPNPEKGTADNYGIGKNGVYVGIQADCEYTLKKNQYLLINYTPSGKVDANGNASKQKPVYKAYGQGEIIKPNFAILDSSSPQVVKSKQLSADISLVFNKTNADWQGKYPANGIEFQSINKLASLGVNEQIEIRQMIAPKIGYEYLANTNAPNFYFYFILNKYVNNDTTDVKKFTLNKSSQQKQILLGKETVKLTAYTYTLDEGEYFLYTDANKLQMAYYGAGSEVVYWRVKPKTQTTVPTDIALLSYTGKQAESGDILDNGLQVVPWITHYFDRQGYLQIREYQFITLTAGDRLAKLVVSSPKKTDETDDDFQARKNVLLNNDYWPVVQDTGEDNAAIGTYEHTAVYRLASEETYKSLPGASNGDDVSLKWQVRSRLGLALGPNTAQTIQKRTVGQTTIEDLIKLTFWQQQQQQIATVAAEGSDGETQSQTESNEKVLQPTGTSTAWLWNIKANTLLIQPSGIVEVDVDQVQEKKLTGLQFLLYQPKPIQLLPDGPDKQNITLKNYQDNYTLIAVPAKGANASASAEQQTRTITRVCANIPSSKYGVFMLYTAGNSDISINAVDLTKTGTTATPVQAIAQYANFLECGGTDPAEGTLWKTTLAFQKSSGAALAVIIVKQACTLQLVQSYDPKAGVDSTKIVLGNLDIVPQALGGFNQQVIHYQFSKPYNAQVDQIGTEQLQYLYTDLKTLLSSNAADNSAVKSFFFNNIPDKDFTLDIGKGYAVKTLDDPRAYFDYNNINNNFVISQIDTDYFTDDVYDIAQGIIITNSSKLNY